MKKTLKLLLIGLILLALSFTMTGCGKEEDDDEDRTSEKNKSRVENAAGVNDIDNLLNSQREIISYKIQTPKTKNIQNNSRITKIHERKNYNLTINTLENIRPLTTFNKRIISEYFY